MEVLGTSTFFLTTAVHGAQWPFGKWSLYGAGIRTPMIAVWPGKIRAGARTDAMVSWIDILPTLVDAAGGLAPTGLDGLPFGPVLRGEKTGHRDRIFTTHSSDGRWNIYPMRSLRTGEWKYIRKLPPEFYYAPHVDLVKAADRPRYFDSWEAAAKTDPRAAAMVKCYHERPAEELYDRRTDPGEMTNLAADPRQAARVAEMRREVEAWMKAQGDEGKILGTPRLLTDADRAEPRDPPGKKAAKKKQ